MSWSTIENVKPSAASSAIPADGVEVGSRRVLHNKRYIYVKIGRELAAAAKFTQAEQGVRLMLGRDNDTGKIAIAIDQSAGNFVAKRRKNGDYQITINAAAAEGLFALDFPKFSHAGIEVVRPANGQPPMFSFMATKAMLSPDDD